MTIDIIDFTAEQFAFLSEEQILQIKYAQGDKDKLTADYDRKKKMAFYEIIEKGMGRSKLYEETCKTLDEEYNRKVERIRNGLVFYLQYSVRGNDSLAENAPYLVNFGWPYEERYLIVREYYMTTYSDPVERFEAFRLDIFAGNYLGEYYGILNSYLRAYAEDTEI